LVLATLTAPADSKLMGAEKYELNMPPPACCGACGGWVTMLDATTGPLLAELTPPRTTPTGLAGCPCSP
jgi:hypothetical protein